MADQEVHFSHQYLAPFNR